MPIHRLTASAPYLWVGISGSGREVDAIALVDTGASMTSVHPDIIRELNAPVIGAVDVSRVGLRPEPTRTYYLKIRFDADTASIGVEVVAAVPSSPCQVLIARDLMSRWVMTVDGPGDRLLIAY